MRARQCCDENQFIYILWFYLALCGCVRIRRSCEQNFILLRSFAQVASLIFYATWLFYIDILLWWYTRSRLYSINTKTIVSLQSRHIYIIHICTKINFYHYSLIYINNTLAVFLCIQNKLPTNASAIISFFFIIKYFVSKSCALLNRMMLVYIRRADVDVFNRMCVYFRQGRRLLSMMYRLGIRNLS